MRLPRRDVIASALVTMAAVVYLLWWLGVDMPGKVRGVAAIVLGLGFVASASAVVPGFAQLLRGSKVYLAVASLVGLAASVFAVIALTTGSKVMLAGLMAATVLLWAMATVRHIRAVSQPVVPPRRGGPGRTAH